MQYADVWHERAFTREEKLQLMLVAAAEPARFTNRVVSGGAMDNFKPRGFADTDWPGLDELFTFQSNGVVTYRDAFVYGTSHEQIGERIRNWLTLPEEQARRA